jgi:hypothetical protein
MMFLLCLGWWLVGCYMERCLYRVESKEAKQRAVFVLILNLLLAIYWTWSVASGRSW